MTDAKPTTDFSAVLSRGRAILVRLTALATTLVAVVGCSNNVDFHWSEETLLQDGRVLTLKRSAQGKSFSEIGGPGGWEATSMTLEIETPKDPGNPPVWSQRWVPMLLDQDAQTKEWIVVATFYTCTDWYDLGRPKLPYVEYRARNGAWEQVPLSTSLHGRKSNLLTGMRSGGEPKTVTINEKVERKKGSGEKFQRVLDAWHTSC